MKPIGEDIDRKENEKKTVKLRRRRGTDLRSIWIRSACKTGV
jgi:hypothetical protein